MIRVKFINDAGTITYNQELKVLEIKFDGTGDHQQHIKSLFIAKDMARIYHCESIMITAEVFLKLDPAEFTEIFNHWLAYINEEYKDMPGDHLSVFLVVAPDVYNFFSEFFSEGGVMSYKEVSCYLFDAGENAYDFLKVKS